MSDSAATPKPVPDKSLVNRFVGVIMSPRETFEAVVAKPRWLGMLVLVTVLMAVLVAGYQMTAVGQQAFLDKAAEGNAFSGPPSPEALKVTEKIAGYMPYITAVSILVMSPVVTLVMAAIAFVIFGAFGGGQATYKQVFAVCAHSGVIGVLGQAIVTPINYIRETMDSPMNLSVFFPMLDAGSFLAKVLGSFELFRVWSVFVLAIGIGVVYRKKTGPIAVTLFVIYAIIAVAIAAFTAARS
jgi:hypothetical protein